jgi:exopolysaccharide biosynthesis polyprenyl glycosylphosphotransferase
VAKRAFDVFFSVLGIIALSPIMLITAIAIKLDSPGPVLFKQKRHGFNNEEIEVLKFRSMYTDMNDPMAKKVVTKGDPRVTKVGRFIRKASIDELPQFFNALRGDLSLVGPRPHAVYAQTRDKMFNEVVEGYFARHRVKPGVTGWAQISGWRGEIDSDEKIKMRTEYDLYYIENWSLWLDLKILFLTPVRLLNTENAY